MGDSEPVTTIKPFQIIRAEDTIIPKESTWQQILDFEFSNSHYEMAMSPVAMTLVLPFK